MFRSIRGTLLFWYTLILVSVVVGFGAALYIKARRSVMGEIHAELEARLQGIAGSLAVRPQGGLELKLPPEYLWYFRKRPWDEGKKPKPPAVEGGEDVAGPPKKPSDDPYYAIWDREGRLVDAFPPDRQVTRPELDDDPHHDPRKPRPRDYDTVHELYAQGPQGTLILVGHDITKANERVQGFLLAVLAAGGGAIAAALAGGWFLARRTLAPVERMTETASRISATNLSERIDLAETESELGRLATVLNGALDRLEAAFRRQARFTADASHELRTPLSVVISHAELALKKERAPEQYRQALETCLRAAGRMKGVVEGLLTLARADGQEQVLRLAPVDLDGVIEEVVTLVAPMAAERRVSIEFSGEAVEILGDRERLRELVTNLVTNAIRYNREGGSVNISARREGNHAVLEVADTGLGIPEADQPHVFERFYRVDKARCCEQGGSGLGLAIARWIAEAHGGSIGLKSREGVGTIFMVRLPCPPAAVS
jgi:heavy metal sensor kinase